MYAKFIFKKMFDRREALIDENEFAQVLAVFTQAERLLQPLPRRAVRGRRRSASFFGRCAFMPDNINNDLFQTRVSIQ
jgi:hypothetical protein